MFRLLVPGVWAYGSLLRRSQSPGDLQYHISQHRFHIGPCSVGGSTRDSISLANVWGRFYPGFVKIVECSINHGRRPEAIENQHQGQASNCSPVHSVEVFGRAAADPFGLRSLFGPSMADTRLGATQHPSFSCFRGVLYQGTPEKPGRRGAARRRLGVGVTALQR